MPFFTAYLLEKEIDSFSVAIYAASMVVTGFSFLLLRIAIGSRLKKAGTIEQEDIAVQRKHYLSLALYVIAIPLAFFVAHHFPPLVASTYPRVATRMYSAVWSPRRTAADRSS